ncbi:MAG: ABC transporter permease [Phycisphaeraceae bacterium]|nr:ABC transporter permease [Phycisphaeraceae bacterium]
MSGTEHTHHPAARALDLVFDRYSLSVGGRRLFAPLSLRLEPGRIMLIRGPSGGGKSSLLAAISGLLTPGRGPFESTGAIRIGGRTVAQGRTCDGVGVVFQQFALFDQWSALDNVRFAIQHRRGDGPAPGAAEAAREAAAILDELGVPHHLRPAQLSGGQQQRLAIARTLGQRPRLVLFDEPTSGLDDQSAQRVLDLLSQTRANHPQTTIIATHDHRLPESMADHSIWIAPTPAPAPGSIPGSIPGSPAPGSTPGSPGPGTSESGPVIAARSEEDGARAADGVAPGIHAGSDRLRWDEEQAGTSAGPTKEAATPRTSPPAAGGNLVTMGGRALGGAVGMARVTGRAATELARLPADLLPIWRCPRWGLRLLWDQLRLVGGVSAWVYIGIVGAIVGFVATDFTFRFLPYARVTDPLLKETLLEGVGFALYRTLIPLLATVLIAARCGAAAAQDIGQRTYSRQLDSLHVLHAPPRRYLLSTTLLAFVIATPVLVWLAFEASRVVSLVVFLANNPDLDPWFWRLHFHQSIRRPGDMFLEGTGWVLAKSLCSALGVGAVAYHLGARPKNSSRDVGRSVTLTILWATLLVLMVHVVFAFFEY